ncbi:MAG: DUF2834 domain-containing protein [Gemmatimonadales bacterium]|nr:DUF2834 domain-containing protein [Gemmatimonadales bacterium]
MSAFYLVAAIVGYIAANGLVMVESIESGNVLLWTKPLDTMRAMFANRISTIFAIDLFYVVLVAFVWFHHDAKRTGVKQVWRYWVLTLLFGLAGTFPLYLHARTRAAGD